MTLYGVTVVLAVLATSHIAQTYTVSYYDCQNIKQLTTYKLGKACDERMNEINSKTKYTLLQERSVTEMRGFSCKVTRTTFTCYCGAYSHTKLAKIPEIEIAEELSPANCLNLVNTQIFSTPDHQRTTIKLGAENIIHSNDLGTLQSGDNSISCRGQPMRFGNNLVNDILPSITVQSTCHEGKVHSGWKPGGDCN